MIKNKKQMFIILGSFLLVLMLFTTTYAFFNYTRTGTSNTIKVGRISFATRQTSTINLVNVFPIDSEDVDTDTDNVDEVVIEIEGDTDYVDGIEYLVSSVDSNVYTSSGVLVPISLDITVDGLGTENANYFTARDSKNANIYKQLVGDTLIGDQMLLVGYIEKNTTNGVAEGVDGSITIKAYLDKNKILISDTYDGTESDNMGTTNNQAAGKTVITTSEWNSLQSSGVSFKIKVEANEGIWVNGSLEEIMRKDAVMDNISSTYVSSNSGIDFGAVSSDTNGKGVYMRAGTENDPYPIMYYRGDVIDNNVIFGNKCWQAVRTTDTGGVKLVYNGDITDYRAIDVLPYDNYDIRANTDGTNSNVWTFDSTDNSWNVSYTQGNMTLEFYVPSGDEYAMEITGKNGDSGSSGVTIYKNDSSLNGTGGSANANISLNYTFGTVRNNERIKVVVSGGGYSTPSTIKVRMFERVGEVIGKKCSSKANESFIYLDDTYLFDFNLNSNSLAYAGYMYGDVYTNNDGAATSGAYFGSSFTWDGANYKLVDPITTKNNTHHYTCNLTTADGTCSTLRYYYYQNSYVNLTGGDGIEEALEKMQTNTNDSNAKSKIDTWYASNMTDFTNKLEDTIWCNDRSFGNNNNNGWIANGGDLSTFLFYGTYQRSNYATNASTVKNQPSLACANKNDRFTVHNGNGNGNLTYPVAMLTEDEIVLAGGVANLSSQFYLNSDLYNYAYKYYWILSPSMCNQADAKMFRLDEGQSGGYITFDSSAGNYGLRPAISIKLGTPVVSGSGTVLDPYVIE